MEKKDSIVIYKTDDGKTCVDVRMDGDMVDFFCTEFVLHS